MIKFILIYVISISSYAGWFSNPFYDPDGEFYDYGSSHDIPQPNFIKKNGLPTPSDTSLRHYFKGQLWDHEEAYQQYNVPASKSPIPLQKDLQNFEDVNEELKYTGLVSYLFYEDGKIKVDAKSSQDRFGDMFDDNTRLIANSMGKSMVSYTLGHAICAGYISSIEERIDYSHLKDTLYDNQRLVDLMNMRAGDSDYFIQGKIKYWSGSIFERGYDMKGSKQTQRNYNYSGFVPHIVINYIMSKFESEDEYKEFLKTTFPGMKNEVYFVKGVKEWKEEDDWRDGWSKASFHASRYDYLRIAKSMLDHYNNDTCVGQYLKDIYKNKESKNQNFKKYTNPNAGTDQYGGFFHFDYKGYWSSPTVFIMDGYGGQMIWINMDDNRIVVTNAIHLTYDWNNIVADVVKNGLEK